MRTYLVGGAVRDKLIGREIQDKDYVVVGATEKQMIHMGFKKVKAKFPVYIDVKTGHEYALARSEKKNGNGYHGFDIKFDTNISLEEDLLRRDLTINAIGQSQDGRIIDPYGGLKDIENKLLRHVSPYFCDDPLRAIRVIRFYACFEIIGFSIARETLDLIGDMIAKKTLKHLPAERIYKEIEKTYQNKGNMKLLWRMLKKTGILYQTMPLLDLYYDKLYQLDYSPSLPFSSYLGMLFCRISANHHQRIKNTLRLSKAHLRQIKNIGYLYLLSLHYSAENLLQFFKKTRLLANLDELSALLSQSKYFLNIDIKNILTIAYKLSSLNYRDVAYTQIENIQIACINRIDKNIDNL